MGILHNITQYVSFSFCIAQYIHECYNCVMMEEVHSYMPASKAQQASQNKWIAKNYDRVNLTLPKGRKAELQAHAEQRGESLNGFIGRAIDEQVKRDNDE